MSLPRRVGADLGAILVVLALFGVTMRTPGLRETPIRILFAIPIVTFVPGYAWTVAIFPHGPSLLPRNGSEAPPGPDPIDWADRAALSIGLSITVVAFLAYGLALTPLGFSQLPLFSLVAGVTILGVVIGTYRREPETAPAWDVLTLPRPSGGRHWLNLFLVIAVLFALVSVGYGVTTPAEQERFSELYVVTEAENGSLQAAGYPDAIDANESFALTVGVNNFEHERTEYVLVARAVAGDAAVELDRRRFSLDHGEAHREQVRLTSPLPGENVEFQFLLYRGNAPANASRADAYRSTTIWTIVRESSQ